VDEIHQMNNLELVRKIQRDRLLHGAEVAELTQQRDDLLKGYLGVLRAIQKADEEALKLSMAKCDDVIIQMSYKGESSSWEEMLERAPVMKGDTDGPETV
jgi:hypothetical protein